MALLNQEYICVWVCYTCGLTVQGDITRYGERKFKGMMKDGYNSAHRSVYSILSTQISPKQTLSGNLLLTLCLQVLSEFVQGQLQTSPDR